MALGLLLGLDRECRLGYVDRPGLGVHRLGGPWVWDLGWVGGRELDAEDRGWILGWVW